MLQKLTELRWLSVYIVLRELTHFKKINSCDCHKTCIALFPRTNKEEMCSPSCTSVLEQNFSITGLVKLITKKIENHSDKLKTFIRSISAISESSGNGPVNTVHL